MMEERKEIQGLRMELETPKRTQAEMKTVKEEITKEIRSSLEINKNEIQQSKHSGKLSSEKNLYL